jgi:predicted amidohydrolase
MMVTLAAIQPRSATGALEHRNADDAVEWVRRAAEAGADLVVFPEGYPGPTNPANDYDGIGALREAARANGVHVIGGTVEAARDGRHRVTLSLIDDQGEVLHTYRRTTPTGPYVYRDIDAWAFDYVEAGDAPTVVETRLGRIGMLVCSELYVPELSRVLAVEGADLIVYPAGGAINELLPGWRTLVWARAIENLVYTSATQNLYGDEEGVGTIAGPEGVLASSADEGMLLATLDLDRLRYLREEDEHIVFPKPYATIPGLMRWRRPELYGALTETADVAASPEEAR